MILVKCVLIPPIPLERSKTRLFWVSEEAKKNNFRKSLKDYLGVLAASSKLG